jgi:hypothetical protein
MKFTIQSGDLENQAKVTLIIGVFEKGELPPVILAENAAKHFYY